MSEILGSRENRIAILKEQIRRLHDGNAPDEVKNELQSLLGQIPYDDVVRAEQELIAEGLPQEEVIKLCDVHTAVLKGAIEQPGRELPSGHPAHTFRQENLALSLKIAELEKLYREITDGTVTGEEGPAALRLQVLFNELMDVDKHYRRKEYLLFPFMEKHGITAPPKVMWAKHDETRALLKKALEALAAGKGGDPASLGQSVVPALRAASDAVNEMIYKENQILLPMSLDVLTGEEWADIHAQSVEIGFCLYDPVDEWRPAGAAPKAGESTSGRINLPTGSFSVKELEAVLNTLPVDITFVDRDDTVRYFSHGRERIFDRNRAIIGRKVQLCHPPASVGTVERILDDFRSGRQESAAFWINLRDRFIHIEYFALRDGGEYLGTLEVSQDLTEKRKLVGEQRLLNYEPK
jgi:hypothetical protein